MKRSGTPSRDRIGATPEAKNDDDKLKVKGLQMIPKHLFASYIAIAIGTSLTLLSLMNLRGVLSHHFVMLRAGKGDYHSYYEVNVDNNIPPLPQTIRRAGMILRDHKVHNTTSTEGIIPSFQYGCIECPRSLNTQLAHYQLMSEQFGSASPKNKRRAAFDLGANKGYFTFFLATLGYDDVHAFEINPIMFHSLHHGMLFNPRSVSDRVHLYPLGISDTIGVMNQQGEGALGFLKPITNTNDERNSNEDVGQEVMTVTLDYFMKHMNIHADIDLIKIDVEGFEIAVLKGAKQTLYQSKVNAMLIEIGPNRWNRAGISLSSGVSELISLSTQFTHSFLLTRASGPFSKSCPTTLANSIQSLTNKQPNRILNGDQHLYALKEEDWGPVISEMDKRDFDCNFWFSK